MPNIQISQWPTPISLRRGTILDAALASDVPVPYQCRSGQCGTCKCRLLRGRVKHDGYLAAALSERERADGWVLACRAWPKTDIEIDYEKDLDSAVPLRQRRTAVVARREPVTHDINRLLLELDGGPLHFNAGQYAYLRFDRLPARSYSMANLPGASLLEFYIREMPGGSVSQYVARQLAVGDRVTLDGPHGQAYLRQAADSPIVAVAGGSGLAPILSIAQSAARERSPRPFDLYFGARTAQDLYGQNILADLVRRYQGLRTHLVLSDALDDDDHRTGFVHEALAADFEDLSNAQVYTAGPPPMVAAVTQTVLAMGGRRENVHSDPFTTAQDAPASPMARLLRRLSGAERRARRSATRSSPAP